MKSTTALGRYDGARPSISKPEKQLAAADDNAAYGASDGAAEREATLCDSAVRKAYARILPVLFLSYIFSYLDRTNVGFAALTMNKALGLSAAQFGWGAGLFFVSYALCEVPSNLALHRFGARRWLGRIMITWGLLAAATAWVVGPHSFYALRLVLGAAEAGFFPGVVFYLASWFPRAYRGRVLAWFTLGVPVSAVISGPLSGALLQIDQVLGLAGWQWLFIAQGLPAALLGIWVWRKLPNTPQDSAWLDDAEKTALSAALAREQTPTMERNFKAALLDARVWMLTLILFGILIGSVGIGMWLPQIIHRTGSTLFATGMYSTIPYIFAAIGMLAWARRMDLHGSYIGTLVTACIVGAVGFVLSTLSPSLTGAIAGVTVAMIGVNAARTALWALPSSFLSGSAAVGGIAFINAVSNFAGLVGPSMIGTIRQQTGSYRFALLAMAAVLALTALAGLYCGKVMRKQAARQAKEPDGTADIRRSEHGNSNANNNAAHAVSGRVK